MKYLVTGGAGFIGCNAARRWLERGHDVVVLDDLSRRGADSNLDWLREQGRFVFERVDIRDDAALDAALARHRDTQVILHLAAQVAVTTSVTEPRHDFEVNALGTFNLLESTRRHAPSAAFLYASTNKVYGGLEHVRVEQRNGRYAFRDSPRGISEAEPLDFHSPYGCSKGAADQYVRDYARIYGMRTVVFRQSCIYGWRQFGVEDQGWVAWFTIAAVTGKPVTIYGDGRQVRDCSVRRRPLRGLRCRGGAHRASERAGLQPRRRPGQYPVVAGAGRAPGSAHRPAAPAVICRMAPRRPAGLRRRRVARLGGAGVAPPDRRHRGCREAHPLGPGKSSPLRLRPVPRVGRGVPGRPDPVRNVKSGPSYARIAARMALVPPPPRNGTVRRSVLDEFPAARTSRRPAPVRRLAASLEERSHPVSLSLQSKILVSHFLLAMVLVGTLHLVRNASWAVQALVAGALTLVLALLLPAVLARVTRLRSLSRSALDISRGDLASPVTTDPSLGRDEIDELTIAIANMQENLRELVGHIQHTASSVADTANDLQRSAENVNGVHRGGGLVDGEDRPRRRDPVAARGPGLQGHHRDGRQHPAHRRQRRGRRARRRARPAAPPRTAPRRRGSPARR